MFQSCGLNVDQSNYRGGGELKSSNHSLDMTDSSDQKQLDWYVEPFSKPLTYGQVEQIEQLEDFNICRNLKKKNLHLWVCVGVTQVD